MAISQTEKVKIELMLIDAICEVLTKVDKEGINHPYWNEDTAALMACAAMCVVKACELPQHESV